MVPVEIINSLTERDWVTMATAISCEFFREKNEFKLEMILCFKVLIISSCWVLTVCYSFSALIRVVVIMNLNGIGDALPDFHPVLKTEISPKDYVEAAGRSASSSVAAFSSHQRPCTADEVRAKLPRTQQQPRSTATDAEDRLYAAAEKGDAALVRALLETSDHGTNIKGSRPTSMKTRVAISHKNPLVAACSTGQISVVEELVHVSFSLVIIIVEVSP